MREKYGEFVFLSLPGEQGIVEFLVRKGMPFIEPLFPPLGDITHVVIREISRGRETSLKRGGRRV